MILADTSIWIDFFRSRPRIDVDLFQKKLTQEKLAVCHPIKAEFFSGKMDGSTYNKSHRLFSYLPRVDVDWNDEKVWEEIIDLAEFGFKKGLGVPGIVDRMILICAIKAKVKVWTLDQKLSLLADSKNLLFKC